MVSTILTEVKTSALADMTTAAPLAAAVLAVVVGVSLGIKLFKKVAGR